MIHSTWNASQTRGNPVKYRVSSAADEVIMNTGCRNRQNQNRPKLTPPSPCPRAGRNHRRR
jgi:hypothetical protein